MPRARPVESSRSLLPRRRVSSQDATGLPRGVLTLAATKKARFLSRCHGLAPWSPHATKKARCLSRCHGLAPWSPHARCYQEGAFPLKMPRARPVESSRSLLPRRRVSSQDATGLPRGVLTLAATKKARFLSRCHGLAPWSPHATKKARCLSRCHGLAPWSPHARCYQEGAFPLKMPRACPVESSRSLLPRRRVSSQDATGLPRGVLTLAAKPFATVVFYSRQREAPRDKPVASIKLCCLLLAASVNLHGTSPRAQ